MRRCRDGSAKGEGKLEELCRAGDRREPWRRKGRRHRPRRSRGTVIVTARTRNSGDSEWPGSLDETIRAINASGGSGVGLLCDHSDDDSVQGVFDRIKRDHGRLDVLVNNVFAAPNVMPVNVPFWQIPMSLWDTMQRVGLRSHLAASRLAVLLMLP